MSAFERDIICPFDFFFFFFPPGLKYFVRSPHLMRSKIAFILLEQRRIQGIGEYTASIGKWIQNDSSVLPARTCWSQTDAGPDLSIALCQSVTSLWASPLSLINDIIDKMWLCPLLLLQPEHYPVIVLMWIKGFRCFKRWKEKPLYLWRLELAVTGRLKQWFKSDRRLFLCPVKSRCSYARAGVAAP